MEDIQGSLPGDFLRDPLEEALPSARLHKSGQGKSTSQGVTSSDNTEDLYRRFPENFLRDSLEESLPSLDKSTSSPGGPGVTSLDKLDNTDDLSGSLPVDFSRDPLEETLPSARLHKTRRLPTTARRRQWSSVEEVHRGQNQCHATPMWVDRIAHPWVSASTPF